MDIVYEICKSANIAKFENIIQKVEEDKKIALKKWFENHMRSLALYCKKNFLDKWILTEDFIKWLHKSHYPKWFIQYKDFEKSIWKVAIMIPWEYKSIENFKRIKLSDTKIEVQKNIDNYNYNIDKTKDKKDFITKIFINFYKIHPFWNWNWVTFSIIYDLMLLKNGYEIVKLRELYKDDNLKKEIYKSIDNSIKNDDIKYFKKMISL